MIYRYNSDKEVDIQPDDGLEQFFWEKFCESLKEGELSVSRVRATKSEDDGFKESVFYRFKRK